MAEKHVKTPKLEEELKKAGCDTVFDEYEKIVERATGRYQAEIDKDYSQILERYRKKLVAYRKKNLQVNIKNFLIGKDKYLFISIEQPVDAKDIWVERDGEKLPYCTTDTGFIFFLQERDKDQSQLTVFIKEDDGFVEGVKYTAGGNFKPFIIKIEENVVILPSPIYGGYMVYGSVKKEFPRFKTNENPCTVNRVEVDKSPQKIFVELPYDSKGIKDTKSYRVY